MTSASKNSAGQNAGLSEETAQYGAAGDDVEILPVSALERAALERYVQLVRDHYGSRLVDVVLFGSRGRGDASATSDADVAVIIKDGDWVAWKERRVLTDLGYDLLIEDGLDVQSWLVAASEWRSADTAHQSALVRNIRRDGRGILHAA
jgi:predicted nucleotidyltransferase